MILFQNLSKTATGMHMLLIKMYGHKSEKPTGPSPLTQFIDMFLVKVFDLYVIIYCKIKSTATALRL